MANISSAEGTMTLGGLWTAEDIETFRPVLDTWKFYGEYGLRCYKRGELTEKHRSCDFEGSGRWDFSSTLKSFDDWTRNWIEPKDDWSRNYIEKYGPELTKEQYEKFLTVMHQKELCIILSFTDHEPGIGFKIHETGVFTSDGEKLTYRNVEEIGYRNREYIKIPEGVTRIGDRAFETYLLLPENKIHGCINLREVQFPESLTSIGKEAFSGCKNLQKIHFSEGLTDIGECAFERCSSLHEITCPASLERINRWAFDRAGLKLIRILGEHTKIAPTAFGDEPPVIVAPKLPLSKLPQNLKAHAILGFIEHPDEFSEEAAGSYTKYIKSQRKKLWMYPEILKVILDKKYIPAKEMDYFMEEAEKLGNPEITKMLSEYQKTI